MVASLADRLNEIYHLRKFQSSNSKKIFARAARHSVARKNQRHLKLEFIKYLDLYLTADKVSCPRHNRSRSYSQTTFTENWPFRARAKRCSVAQEG